MSALRKAAVSLSSLTFSKSGTKHLRTWCYRKIIHFRLVTVTLLHHNTSEFVHNMNNYPSSTHESPGMLLKSKLRDDRNKIKKFLKKDLYSFCPSHMDEVCSSSDSFQQRDICV